MQNIEQCVCAETESLREPIRLESARIKAINRLMVQMANALKKRQPIHIFLYQRCLHQFGESLMAHNPSLDELAKHADSE